MGILGIGDDEEGSGALEDAIADDGENEEETKRTVTVSWL